VQAAFIDPDCIFPGDAQIGKQFKHFLNEYGEDSPAMAELVRENAPFAECKSTYAKAARRGIENEMIFVMKRTAVRILASELLACGKHMITAPPDSTPLWQTAAVCLIEQGAEWMVQERDLKTLKPDWYVEGRRKVPMKRPRTTF